MLPGLNDNSRRSYRSGASFESLSLRDLRHMPGVDHVIDGGGSWIATCDLAFNRSIEYESTQTDIKLSDGILLQTGWRYENDWCDCPVIPPRGRRAALDPLQRRSSAQTAPTSSSRNSIRRGEDTALLQELSC